ncbi:MAG: glycosyltransferase family 1 protein [Epsilonproteobacteria bacterium]|nr:glycosyltransferase family 1 protein [Campylobacterota bacterium]
MFVSEMTEAFEAAGDSTYLVDLTQDSYLEQIAAVLASNKIDCVIGFNGIGSNIEVDGQSLYDAINTNYLAVYIDHPAYHVMRIINPMRNHLVSCIDEAHLSYIEEILPTNYKINFFLPHAGLKSSSHKIEDIEEYKQLKSIDLLFSGTYFQISQKPWQDVVDAPHDLIDEVIERLIYGDYLSAHEVFNDVFNSANIKFSQATKAQLSNLLVEILSYVRAYNRNLLIEKLLKCGMKITVCGNGWESLAKKYKNLDYKGALNIEDVITLTQKAKVCIHAYTNLTRGTHERIFTAMLNYSVVFTDRSSYLDKYYSDDASLLYYNIKTLDRDIKRLQEYLLNDVKVFKIASSAYDITNKNHLWIHRVQKIKNIITISMMADK